MCIRDRDINDDTAVKGTTIYQRLIATGISHKLAESWIAQYGEDYCAAKLDIVSRQKASGAKIVSVTGFLSAAIKDDYKAGPADQTAQAKAEREAQEIARRKSCARTKLTPKGKRSARGGKTYFTRPDQNCARLV